MDLQKGGQYNDSNQQNIQKNKLKGDMRSI